MALSEIAIQHADGGYSRRGNLYGFSLVCNMVLIYFPDGTNVYGSRSGECGGQGGSRGNNFKICS